LGSFDPSCRSEPSPNTPQHARIALRELQRQARELGSPPRRRVPRNRAQAPPPPPLPSLFREAQAQAQQNQNGDDPFIAAPIPTWPHLRQYHHLPAAPQQINLGQYQHLPADLAAQLAQLPQIPVAPQETNHPEPIVQPARVLPPACRPFNKEDIQVFNLGAMIVVCPSCKALHWMVERL
jgi:hypothetical protein